MNWLSRSLEPYTLYPQIRLVQLSIENLGNLNPDSLYSAYHYSHVSPTCTNAYVSGIDYVAHCHHSVVASIYPTAPHGRATDSHQPQDEKECMKLFTDACVIAHWQPKNQNRKTQSFLS